MPAAVKESFVDTEIPLFGEGVTPWRLLNIFLAELIGTALLLFWGCMGVNIGLSHLEVCLAFGMAVASIVQMMGHISTSHINPSVTMAAIVLGKINIPMAVVYWLAECIGAILGYQILLALTPSDVKVTHCCTLLSPSVSLVQGVFAEFFFTSLLIFLVCAVWDKRNAHVMDSVPLKFGFCVSGIALAGGKYTHASLNPARSLGPAVCEWIWTNHWVYWMGPMMAGLLVPLFYRYILDRPVRDSYSVTGEDIPLNEQRKTIP